MNLDHPIFPKFTAFSALGRELDMINQDACAYAGAHGLIKFGGNALEYLDYSNRLC